LIANSGEVITGNEKGEINIYSNITGKLLHSESCHSGAIQYLEEDSANNILISASDQTGIVVFKYGSDCWEELRSLKGSFIGKEMFAIAFSAYHSIIGFISGASAYILDYEQFKILFQFSFEK
jgi:hypothetical protein